MIRILPAIAILATAAAMLAASGCGSDNGSGSGSGGVYGGRGETGSTQAAESEAGGGSEVAPGGDGVVAVATSPDLGRILVDSKGFTLYDFHKDKGTESACYGACAGVWPPLTTSGRPQATSGAESGMLGTTKREDGTLQVTYAGHPLYTYVGDDAPGQARGNKIDLNGGYWYEVRA